MADRQAGVVHTGLVFYFDDFVSLNVVSHGSPWAVQPIPQLIAAVPVDADYNGIDILPTAVEIGAHLQANKQITNQPTSQNKQTKKQTNKQTPKNKPNIQNKI